MKKVVFSYDYELCWGVWDAVPISYAKSNVINSNIAVQILMDLHAEFEIPATWAIVGAAADRQKTIEQRIRQCGRNNDSVVALEEYANSLQFSSEYFEIPGEFFERISKAKHLFELASHTYGHVYANKEGSYLHGEDAMAMRKILGPEAVSVIFPKNIITTEVLNAVSDQGFQVIRVNPDNILYRNQASSKTGRLVQRTFRYADSYFPVQECLPNKKSSSDGVQIEYSVGQYFVRPLAINGVLNFLHAVRMQLPLQSFSSSQCIHYWSHPHNFGNEIEKCFINYRYFFEFLSRLRDEKKIYFELMGDSRGNVPHQKYSR